jgi:hypothetical protein
MKYADSKADASGDVLLKLSARFGSGTKPTCSLVFAGGSFQEYSSRSVKLPLTTI